MTKPIDPTNVQTAEQVEQYYRNVKPGDLAAIRSTQGSFLVFTITKIADTNPKRGRVYIEDDDAWGGRAYYAKNGKSCFHPTGQINLVVPTEEVLAWAKDPPRFIKTYEADSHTIPPGQRTADRMRGYRDLRKIVMERSGKKKP
ncbi:hypothetical protein J4G48_0040000 [Bradyrhizobium barranii subsp. apii]|uniref:hypothetical protein n=1 Tax=Bradyrhizobium barranii TaxID=2992140 RepID=UPI001AA0BC92|nr:hypothetical protein [Bradyrhizobium barranii]UPT95342.1 hypothetical protein J4G48_0040000 [Bradyrhizobium barranii subsp. apii]